MKDKFYVSKLICAGLLICGLSLTGCERQGPAERTGERINEAAKDVREATNDAVEAVKDTAEDARENVDDARDDLGEAIKSE